MSRHRQTCSFETNAYSIWIGINSLLISGCFAYEKSAYITQGEKLFATARYRIISSSNQAQRRRVSHAPVLITRRYIAVISVITNCQQCCFIIWKTLKWNEKRKKNIYFTNQNEVSPVVSASQTHPFTQN